MTTDWSINELLISMIGFAADTHPQPRAEIWASDIGKPFLDRFLAMKGHPYTNPVDGKTLMNFFLGKQIELGLIEMLDSCNLTYQTQERIRIDLPNCLPVVGKPDLLLEVSDWDLVLKNIDENIQKLLSDNLDDAEIQVSKKNTLKQIVEQWRVKYPNGLSRTPFEIKTINTNAFNYFLKQKTGFSDAHPHYQLQLYTYMLYYGLDKGRLVYISKNDGRMIEVVIRRTTEMDTIWKNDVQTMSDYFNRDELPPAEPLKVNGKANWKVSYSRYKDYLHNNYKYNRGLL